MPKFEIFRDITRQYRWRLKASNGEIIACSEAYVSKQSAINCIMLIKKLAPIAQIVDTTIY